MDRRVKPGDDGSVCCNSFAILNHSDIPTA